MAEDIHQKVFTPKNKIMMTDPSHKSSTTFRNGERLYIKKVLMEKGIVKVLVFAEYPNDNFTATIDLNELEEC